MSGLRRILLMTLLLGGLGVASAQEPQTGNELSQNLVSARIQTLRDSGSQEGAETTIGSYEAVLNWLGEAEVRAASEKTYLQAQIDAPGQEAEIRDRMETMEYHSADIDPATTAKLSKEKLDSLLAALRLKQRESQAQKSQVDEKILSEQSSAPNIQVRFASIDKRLQELPGTPVTIEPDLQPSQFEAAQWATLAERRALNAERRSLEAQLASQSMRYSRRKAESEELTLILNGLTHEIDVLEKEIASRAEDQESETSVSLDENTPGYSFVQQLVDNNTQLREQGAELDKTLAALKTENQQIEKQLLSLKDRFEGVRTLVSLAEDSASLGPVLMVHWHQTDSFRLDDASSITLGAVGDHVIQRTRYEDTLNGLSNTTSYVKSGFSADIGSPESEIDEKLVETAKDLVRSKRELLTTLISSETELVNTHGNLERNRSKLGEQVSEYQAYLGGRILWVPSHPPLSSDILNNVRQEVGDFFSRLSNIRFTGLTTTGALVLVLAMTLLGLRSKIDSRLRVINKKVGRVREDSILHTLRALLLTLIRKHKYDIYDIPIAEILKEYLGAIEVLREFDLDRAGDFLVMAATLAQIKSRMLLPRHLEEDGEEGEDPRAELVRRLLEYERFREAAAELEDRPRLGRDVFARDEAPGEIDGVDEVEVPIKGDLFHLLLAFKDVLKEASESFIHEVSRQRMTTQEAMGEVLERFSELEPGESMSFRDLFVGVPTKDRIIALFMGILELMRIRAIKVKQSVEFGEIRLEALPREESE